MSSTHCAEQTNSTNAFDKAPLIERFVACRNTTEQIISPLTPEDCCIQSMPDASPAKWHLAHTTWYFETFILEPFIKHYKSFNNQFKYLFNSYYNSVGAQYARPQRGCLSRPSLEDVLKYRQHVTQSIIDFLATQAAQIPIEAIERIIIGINHEQQHQELLLTDIKHHFSVNPLNPTYKENPTQKIITEQLPIAFIAFDSAPIEQGANLPATPSIENFVFDNETPKHTHLLPSFSLANRLVTNKEYLSFMQDGGYDNPAYWLSDGWIWRQKQAITAPLYWKQQNEAWYHYTLSGFIPIEMHTPVCHVSFYEAYAFANWFGARLPTEYEWEHAAKLHSQKLNFSHANLLENNLLQPEAAANRKNTNENTIQQLIGDTWEWTTSPYQAYPNYTPYKQELAEYNAKFMCNQIILRGGSCYTPTTHIRPTYRNFFYPKDRWQMTGIRLAQSAAT